MSCKQHLIAIKSEAIPRSCPTCGFGPCIDPIYKDYKDSSPVPTPYIPPETKSKEYTGISFVKETEKGNFSLSITCPCGVTVIFPVDNLPEKDIPHPCGDPAHFSVKFNFN